MKLGVRLSSLRISTLFCLGILLLCANGAWAQTSTAGTVAGQVMDEQNAAIAGAEVKVTDTATSTSQTASTNAEGRFVFSQVPPGNYNISFTKQGFAAYQVNSQSVQIGQSLTVNAILKVGSTATTVEVTASAGAELQTMNATVGNTLGGETLRLLPNISRDVTTFAVLQPGVGPTGATAGMQNDQNTYQLDGGNITDDMGGNVTTYTTNFTGLGGAQTNGNASGIIPTPVESIEEFKVSTSNQTSDFNNSSGSQIQLVTKRGTNQFHGAVYAYYFDTAVGAANTWTANHTPATVNGVAYGYTPIVSNHRDRFGAAIGGPMIPKNFLGGKWFFFFNFEGLRFPNSGTYTRNDPSLLMRAGVIQVQNAAGTYLPYNLNPFLVTVSGVTYQPASCANGLCDPRGIGLNPIVNKIWSTQMPLANNPLGGDMYNTQQFLSTIRAPLTSNTYVGRIDHDFNSKWRWYGTYRDLKLVNLTTNQVDIGGVLPGDTLGTPAAVAPRPQQPSFWATGLATTINPSTTNTFVFNYTRQFWQWADANGAPQLPGLGGAVEIGGESAATNALIPYNVNTQSIRQRFWDGQDKLIRDDLTMLKGNHLLGFGGSYQRDYDYHSRTDNGAGVNNQVVYQVANLNQNWTNSPYIPSSVPTSQQSTYETLYDEVLGIVGQPQVMYTRQGSGLNLQAIGTPASDKDIIPTYSTYFYDTWHVKPSFTLTYGLGWNLELPPYELNGSQVEVVDSNGGLLATNDYFNQRQKAALAGSPSSYNPTLGFELVRNVGSGLKYPYNPYYGEFSPRASFAWNPHFSDGILGKIFGSGKTVVRGGYGRIFGRLNGVDLVLVPLLGPGLLQGVTCAGASSSGQCLGTGNVDPTNAFRIGTDGMAAPLPSVAPTLAQPFYPGLGSNPETVDPSALDPNFKPNRTDNFTLTVQRELSSHLQLEVGYIGKIIRNEFAEENLDAVPYMTTLNNQTFAQAYSQLFQAVYFQGVNPANVASQPFFEAALGGSGSAYCAGYSSCTAAVASKNTSLIKGVAVSDLWLAMNKAPSWTLGRTMLDQPLAAGGVGQSTSIGMLTSNGWGNYNAAFATLRTTNFHGVTAISNLTFGRALGTGSSVQATSSETVLTPFDLQTGYGPQTTDIKLLFNIAMFYQPQVFKGQHGVVGHILGGWTFSPLFTAQSGNATAASVSSGTCTDCQAFGEAEPPASVSGLTENAVGWGPYTGGHSAHYGCYGANGVGTTNKFCLSEFTNPAAVINEFRPCVLGYDTSCGGAVNLRGLPQFNMDLSIVKDIGIHREQVGAQVFFLFTNVMNHFQPSGGSLNLSSPATFGVITGQANTPRNLEFGLRIHF